MVSLIWAQAANGVIGKAGGLPWRLPEDLRRFRELTMGSTVLMGRRTWESLPDSARPLPGRHNLVVTRQADWSAHGAVRVPTIEDGVAQAPGDLWVIGGAQVYRSALPLAAQIVMTELEAEFVGDVYAPRLDPTWAMTQREPCRGWAESSTGLRYRVTTYDRQRG
jgi:dihydrofolate reductase